MAYRRAIRLVPVLLVGLAVPTAAADLQPRTAAAFDRYVTRTEAEMDLPQAPALLLDTRAEPARGDALSRLRKGELLIERRATRDGNREFEIPDGLVHHWVGTVFVPGVTAEAAAALLHDYDRHGDIYAPAVQRSRLITRDGDRFTMFLRFYQKKVIAVVVNSEHEAVFTRRPGQISSRIHSTRIAEVESPGTASEREKPVGRDGGYLWRLNSYWHMVERDGGVYIQCESITLTRDIPFGFGWLVGPFVTSIPRESLEFTLNTTRKVLLDAAAR